MTPDDIRQQIELRVVEVIKSKLSDGSITEARAQEMSQKVLELLKPGMSFEELYRAVPKLDDPFPELAPVVLPIVREYEERVVKEAQKEVTDLIRQGHYDAATKLAEDAVKQNVKLTWVGKGKPIDKNA